ncbi:T9SS type A sorting domain-containing protein [Lacinutrix chionoecetis]
MRYFFMLLSCLVFNGLQAQCSINPYIQANYEKDAYVLALREILSDVSDPDYNNPFIPVSRTTSYLEDLSAIYNNPNNDSEINLIFNDFDIHANQEYKSEYQDLSYQIDFKILRFSATTSDSWINDFKTTGVSGIPELDNLMSTYQFTVDSFTDLSSCACTIFEIETNNDYMNLKALEDDFEAIPEIDTAETNFPEISYRFNYTGVPYNVEVEVIEGTGIYDSAMAEVSNIIVDGENYIFGLYAQDCLSSCTLEENRIYSVDSNCNTLATQQFDISQIKMYPNPTTTQLNFSSNNGIDYINVIVYDLTGKHVLETIVTNKLDVTSLNSGVYLIKLIQAEKATIKKLIIK